MKIFTIISKATSIHLLINYKKGLILSTLKHKQNLLEVKADPDVK